MSAEPQPEGSSEAAAGGGGLPWSRAALLLAVAGPALALGGVKPWVIPAFALVVAGLLLRRCLRSPTPLRVPAWWWLGLAAAGLTALQWLPLPGGVVGLLAPGLHAEVEAALAGTGLESWSRLSVQPGQTGLECARLLALTGLFVASAQLSWRLVIGYVAFTGTTVALIGLVQKLAGVQAIYGLYRPRQEFFGLGQDLGTPLLTSFVNPNHQSALFLLGMFAAAAAAVDLRARAIETRSRDGSERLADRAYLAWGALAIQATALVLSMSRGALLSLLLVAPLALWFGMNSRAPVGSEPGRAWRRRALQGTVLLLMVAVAATQGAWEQLASLRDPQAFHDKFRVAHDSLALIPLSPALGTGRGTFVDLFPLVDPQPGVVQFTHLECTPLAFMVEWGPVLGAALVLGLGLWWLQSVKANAGVARRLALCGLLAVGIHSCADFSLDFLGVAAPAVALAGALGLSKPGKSWASKRVLAASLAGAAAAIVLAAVSMPGSWSARHDRDLALLAGEQAGEQAQVALATTPLDPFVHLALARQHAAAGDWSATLQRAEVAARLRPASLDAQILAAIAADRLDRPLDAIAHLRQGLEQLHGSVSPELVEFLLTTFPDPRQLAAIAPDDGEAWAALVAALREQAPAHARALAQARSRSHPDDPAPLRVQAQLALDQANPGLALHHARLLLTLTPDEAAAHELLAKARFALGGPEQVQQAVAELELARERSRMDDPAVIDELLVWGLIRVGDRPALERADLILDELLARRAEPQARRRRQELAERVHAALERQ